MNDIQVGYRAGFIVGFVMALAIITVFMVMACILAWFIFKRKEQTKMTKPPCKGCKDRVAVPNCHHTCELYLEWSKVHSKERAEERKQIESDQDFIGYKIESAKKCSKRRRTRTRKG